MNDNYTFGTCAICGKQETLKNGICINCSKSDVPDFLKVLFSNKGDKNENL
ncbi:MAG: hypothetical protein V1901_03920 [Patescibacteria group bacterium]